MSAENDNESMTAKRSSKLIRDLLEPDPILSRILDRGMWANGALPESALSEIGYRRGRRFDLSGFDSITKQWMVRERYVREFSFAIPSKETIDLIAERSPRIIEIGAGTGFWGSLLSKAGADIISTDNEPRKAFEVPYESMEASQAVVAYPDRDVLCVWPSLGEDWATKAAKAMKPGRTLFYVGEWRGCTADDGFHDLLHEEFEEIVIVGIPSFTAVNDELFILRKREPEP